MAAPSSLQAILDDVKPALYPDSALISMVIYTGTNSVLAVFFPTAMFAVLIFTWIAWLIWFGSTSPKVKANTYTPAEVEIDDEGLAVMKGSQKQGEWAEDIRRQRIDEAKYTGYNAENELNDDGDDTVVNWLKRQGDVRMWIDTQHMSSEEFYQYALSTIADQNNFVEVMRSTCGPLDTKNLLSHFDRAAVYSRRCMTKDCIGNLFGSELNCPKCHIPMTQITVATEIHGRKFLYPIAIYSVIVFIFIIIGAFAR